MKQTFNSLALYEGIMKNGIARANPIMNSSKISTREIIRG